MIDEKLNSLIGRQIVSISREYMNADGSGPCSFLIQLDGQARFYFIADNITIHDEKSTTEWFDEKRARLRAEVLKSVLH